MTAREVTTHEPAAPEKSALWIAWPWVTWLLPALLVLSKLVSGRAGWEGVFLIVSAPIAIPIIGLLGSLPRFLLRRRGWTSVPTPVAVLLVAQWWMLTFFVHAMTAVGDSGNQPSLLSEAFGFTERTAEWLSALGFFTWLLLFVATIVIAWIIARRDTNPTPSTSKTALITFVSTPIIVIAVAMVGSSLHRASIVNAPDSAGLTGHEAQEVTDPDEAHALTESRWDALQQELVPLRETISNDAWAHQVAESGQHQQTVRETALTQVRLEVGWRLVVREDPEAIAERSRAWIEGNGWVINERMSNPPIWFEGDTPEGSHFWLSMRAAVDDEGEVADPGFAIVRLDLRSGPFWEHAADIDWQRDASPEERAIAEQLRATQDLTSSNIAPDAPELVRDPAEHYLSYRADDWPSFTLNEIAIELYR